MTGDLPVLDVIEQIRDALGEDRGCVLIAPPGTGKTTGVPPALLDEPWLGDNRIVMLEPRRLAARAGATRMAATRGDKLGETFGYSVRGESRTSARTKVELVTEGLFLRRLQNDPALEGVGAVIFDEFHERSVDSDLALTLLCDARGSLRPDLRLVVMSATMDPGPAAALLDAPTVVATTTTFPVQTHYRPGSVHEALGSRVADVISEVLRNESGDVLVFLPGRPEIHRTRRVLERRLRVGSVADSDVASPRIVELHGSLSPGEQQLALEPDPAGRRKIVLATSLAETSITVPGVRAVVDSGRRRTTVVDPRTGLSSLVTVAVSRAGAHQRRGRAGRTAPGAVYRLWGREEERHRRESDQPEILTAELSSLLLQLRAWGVSDPAELAWLDPPPAVAMDRASELLTLLGAFDAEGHLSARGRDLASIGFHPRLAAIALHGMRLGYGDLAADICALVETGGSGSVDLLERVESLHQGGIDGETVQARRQWRSTIRRLSERDGRARDGGASDGRTRETRTRERGARDGGAGGIGIPQTTEETVADLLIAGYPDRIARQRDAKRTDASGRARTVFQLRTGAEIMVPEGHPLERAKWLVAADVDVESRRLHLGVALSERRVLDRFSDEFTTEEIVEWDDRAGVVEAKRATFLGSIKVREVPLAQPSSATVTRALQEAFDKRGLGLFGRLAEADQLRSRIALVKQTDDTAAEGEAEQWPDFSDDALREQLPLWLGDRMTRITSVDDFNRVDVVSLLREQLCWDQLVALDGLAPTSWTLATGRKVRLEYGRVDGDSTSVLASVRLSDAFGTDTHPSVMAGRVPVTVELLSPAGRPVQRTTDLPGFWRGSYRDVRSELRGRYPKHPWPEEPHK